MRTAGRKVLIIAAVILATAAAAAGIRALDEHLNKIAWEKAADVVYPMANQHIEWTYAGKDGAGR
jgi:hypothetical protein